MTLQPCLVCGEPSRGSRCDEHQQRDQRVRHRADTGGTAWIKLSARARRLQPFCLLCGRQDHLQADHSPRAWRRMQLRKPLRLCDVNVVCRDCNSRIGSSKPGSARYQQWERTDGDVSARTPDETLGGGPLRPALRPARKARNPLHISESTRDRDETGPLAAEQARASTRITPEGWRP